MGSQKKRVAEKGVTPLSKVKPGGTVRLINISAGHMLRSRLFSMGFVQGKELTVISNSFKGPIMLSFGTDRLTIGRGAAEKINVVICKKEKET